MPFLVARDGCGIHYQKFGHGRIKIIFVMGFSVPYSAWAYQIQHFGVSNGTTYEVIGIDNRGIGLSDVPLLPFNIVTMADDVHEIVLKEGCHPCHMVGISMGGMITLEFAYKGIFGTLKSVINRDMSGDVIMFGSFTPVEKRGALTLKMWRDFRRIHKLENHEELVRHGRSPKRVLNAKKSLYGIMLQNLAIYSHYVSYARLRTIKDSRIPTLVCYGSDDNLIRPSNSIILSRALQCDVEKFEGCGHVPTVEKFQEFNAILERHISRASSEVRPCLISKL